MYLYFLSRTPNDQTHYGCNEQYDVLALFLGFCVPLLYSYGLIINYVSFSILMDMLSTCFIFCDLFIWWCLANTSMPLLGI